MKDRVHQPYRKALVCLIKVASPCHTLKPFHSLQIPGLPEVTSEITPSTHRGLLGICLSGAGPTILALATEGFESIAEDARTIFKKFGVEIDWKVLDVVGGSTITQQ
jgi:homoserine kinase